MKKYQVAGGFPLLGHLTSILKDPLTFLTEAHRTYGDTFSFRLLKKQVWVFVDPNDVKKIFFEHSAALEKSSQRTAFGKSVLTSNGEEWKRMRRTVASFFSRSHINSLGPRMREISQQFSQNLGVKNEIDLYASLGEVINQIVVELLFGQTKCTRDADLREPMEAITDYVLKMSALPFPVPDWFPLPVVQKKRKAMKQFEALLNEVLVPVSSHSGPRTFVQTLTAQGEVPESELRTQCLAFYLAGFETTLNALFWTFYEIFRHPALAAALRAESRAHLRAGEFTIEALEERLPLLRSTLSESLRLWPPVWFRTRVANRDFQVANVFIKKGDMVWVSPYLNHRRENSWEQATEFQAERFLKKNWPRDLSYYPFSSGLNTCTGEDFAWLELMIVTATLLETLEVDTLDLHTPEPFPRKVRVSIRPDRPLRLRVRSGIDSKT